MKPRRNIRRNLLLCTLILPLQGVSGAVTLYSQTFASTSTANLHNTTVQGGTLSANWTSSNTTTTGTTANFMLDGTTGASNGSAVLPFVPTTGMIYTLSATVSSPTGTWGGLGFSNATTGWQTSNDPRFTGGTNTGQPWMIHKGAGTGGQSAFPGPSTTVAVVGTSVFATSVDLTVELNTIGTAWTTSFFVDGTQYGSTHVYATNPTINSVGITASNTGTKDFSNFSLTAVPEPSAALLGSLGVLALLRRRR